MKTASGDSSLWLLTPSLHFLSRARSTSARHSEKQETRRSGGEPLTSLATWMRENAVFSCELVPVRHRVASV